MKAPKPKDLEKVYRAWEIASIFRSITRKASTRADLWHNIAHGDATADATQQDIARYSRAVTDFCDRVDRLLARKIAKMFDIPKPW